MLAILPFNLRLLSVLSTFEKRTPSILLVGLQMFCHAKRHAGWFDRLMSHRTCPHV